MTIEQEEAVRRESMRKAVEGTLEQFRSKQAPTVGFQPLSDAGEVEDARDVLRESILETARWRREKMIEFPNDHRNRGAAELLELIAETVNDVPDVLMRQYGEAWSDDISARTSEAQSILLRDIALRSNTIDASKLIEHLLDHVADFRADLREG